MSRSTGAGVAGSSPSRPTPSRLWPWAALGRFADAPTRFHLAEIADAQVRRVNSLCSLSDDELSPAALAARVVLADVARTLVRQGRWAGAMLHHGS